MKGIDIANPETLLIALAVVVLALVRQMQASALSPLRLLLMPVLLGYLVIRNTPALAGIDGTGLALLALGVTGGLVLGVARGFTIRVWIGPDGKAWTRGTWVTLALWALLFGLRIALGGVEHVLVSPAALVLADALWTAFATFAAQNLVTWVRAANAQRPSAVDNR